MCLNIDHEVEKDGSFDGVPSKAIPEISSYAAYSNTMNFGVKNEKSCGNSGQDTAYNAR